MKFKFFMIAAAAMALTVACNNNKTAEVADSITDEAMTAVEDMVNEDVPELMDTVAAVAEKTVANTAKKAATAVKEEVKQEAAKVVNNNDGTSTVNNTMGTRGQKTETKTEATVTNNQDGSSTVKSAMGTRKRN